MNTSKERPKMSIECADDFNITIDVPPAYAASHASDELAYLMAYGDLSDDDKITLLAAWKVCDRIVRGSYENV